MKMRQSRRVTKKVVKYRPEENSDDEKSGDFEDSGSEASIDEEDDDDDSEGVSSGEDFAEKSIVKSGKKKIKPVFVPKPKNTLKQALQRNSVVNNTESLQEEPLISVKDLTEQEKLLPEFLNLSESDSDSEAETDRVKKETSALVPLDYESFVEKNMPGPSTSKVMSTSSDHISRLSASESDSEPEDHHSVSNKKENQVSERKINFQNLHEQSVKLEEAKKTLELYNQKKKVVKEKVFDVGELLALGEDENERKESVIDSDASDSDDFEEVKETKISTSQTKDVKSSIQVLVDLPTNVKRSKKPPDLQMIMKRRINRVKKEFQVYMHKVHVLSWIAHGNFLNKILNSESLMAAALSLMPSEQSYPGNRVDIKYLEQITKWFCETIKVKEDKNEFKFKPKKEPLLGALLKQIAQKTTTGAKNKVLIFIGLLRSIGLKCRLVLSFQVLPLKPPATELISLSTNEKKVAAKTSKHFKKDKKNATKAKVKVSSENISQLDGADDDVFSPRMTRSVSKTTSNKNDSKKRAKPEKTSTISYWDKITQNIEDNSKKRVSHRDLAKAKPNFENFVHDSTKRKTLKSDSRVNKPSTSKSVVVSKAKSSKTNKGTISREASKSTSKKKESTAKNKPSKPDQITEKTKRSIDDTEAPQSSAYFTNNLSPKEIQVIKNGINNLKKDCKNVKKSKHFNTSPAVTSSKVSSKSNEKGKLSRKRKDSNGSDFDFKPDKKKVKRVESDEIDRRVLSTDDEHQDGSKKRGVNLWCEVYVEEEEQWISVDVLKSQVHCVHQIYSRANHPVTYVVSWDSSGHVKDVTQRYVPHWNTVTRKLRVDAKWYETALKPWMAPRRMRDSREDEQLNRMQLDAPMPKSISEFKNHPLYALKRHLLKFEVIYPPNAVTLGFVKNEAVYARECVHTCRSRETWVKEAKVVKPNEKPYKIVKARPKYDRLSGTVIKDIPLEVFGPWQVEDYVPPKAEGGKVPRNPYGNVELFKPCMLPGGTVHLDLPGLNKVAKKLGIDCAPAMIGFDYHMGGAHPAYEGFVVCEEFKDTLLAAWEQEQAEAERRATEKVEKRVYGNWKRLINGLLVRERLKLKYDFQSGPQNDSENKKASSSKKRSKN